MIRIIEGDCRDALKTLPDASVQCVVTSPPYWGLRDCGLGDNQIGLEPTPQLYVSHLVGIFREVKRVLRDDGVAWLNLGDSYASSGNMATTDERNHYRSESLTGGNLPAAGRAPTPDGLKPKDLVGIPWRVAFALQDDGWWLRSDVIWHKPNCMPESVTDRPTKAHEYLFLLSKAARYFYDADAVREDFADDRMGCDGSTLERQRNRGGRTDGFTKPNGIDPSHNGGRNRRTVWTIPTRPFPEAHFATFPRIWSSRASRRARRRMDAAPNAGHRGNGWWRNLVRPNRNGGNIILPIMPGVQWIDRGIAKWKRGG